MADCSHCIPGDDVVEKNYQEKEMGTLEYSAPFFQKQFYLHHSETMSLKSRAMTRKIMLTSTSGIIIPGLKFPPFTDSSELPGKAEAEVDSSEVSVGVAKIDKAVDVIEGEISG
jgi:hypothetical protein